ncbi:hypothetical protein GCM10028803_16230 [Larkinella knui]|uniref:DUF2892 domain-containing protein n=1 Tax=Larkinella knui TaxID=2025310 RepID=A0A3P1CU11_9BACT|nr:DUF2892 domain-containing protein [Larkinella knui]RRB16749.1 DUF2892 domain-containing protein [Larkinella knui]
MKRNMGFGDKVVRLLIACILIALFIADVLNGVWAVVAMTGAGLLIATSFMNFCPLYAVFGIRTNHRKKMS